LTVGWGPVYRGCRHRYRKCVSGVWFRVFGLVFCVVHVGGSLFGLSSVAGGLSSVAFGLCGVAWCPFGLVLFTFGLVLPAFGRSRFFACSCMAVNGYAIGALWGVLPVGNHVSGC
jgi:hypothetical protein